MAVFATLLLLAAPPSAHAAQKKTDVVELVNGDRITCEISKLEGGKLTVKTDDIGTIAVEWDNVERLTSTATFEIELTSGERLFGTLARGAAKTVDITSPTEGVAVPLERIIRIWPIGGTFWRRLDGALDAGFSFTQANLQTQWTFHSEVRYRSRKWYSRLVGDSALTVNEDADRQTRNNLSLQTRRYLRPLWSLVGFAQFQQNEELSLNLRTVLGGGGVRALAQSNRIAANAVAALAFTQEQYEDADDLSVPEAVGGLAFQWFTFDGRSTDLSVEVLSFYALDGSSRARLELNSAFRSDIVGDLYWSINTFESYNSEPPQDRKSNDFGVSAAVGWSF